MQSMSLLINSRKLQSQKGNFTMNYAIFLSNNYMVKEGEYLHGGSLEVKAGLIRGCNSRKDLIQGSEVQLRALVGAKSFTVLRRYLGLVSGMEHGGNSGFREMLKPVKRWGLWKGYALKHEK